MESLYCFQLAIIQFKRRPPLSYMFVPMYSLSAKEKMLLMKINLETFRINAQSPLTPRQMKWKVHAPTSDGQNARPGWKEFELLTQLGCLLCLG